MSRLCLQITLLLAALLAGCTLLNATPSIPLDTPAPPPAQNDSDGWQLLAPGLEQRTYTASDLSVPPITALRIDPTYYTFRAHYQPGQPLNAQEWQDALPGVVAFVNANFFAPDYTIQGLLVADGIPYGTSYQGRGGMFQVQNGQPRVRSLVNEPYFGEALEQAVQAFPMLVVDGQAAYTNPNATDTSRRTVVAQDSSGRILLMTVAFFATLPNLSAYLASTDMMLVNALNLDGGRSTMMAVNVENAPYLLPSFQAVPSVLAVYPK